MHKFKDGDRNRGIGGTDAKRIAAGEWQELYDEKVNGTRVDLSHIFRVQLGLFTEPLHAEWYIRQTGHQLTDPGNDPITSDHAPEDFMFATLDRWIVPLEHPLEMKHTNEGNSLESAAVYYMAQLQHQMMVMGVYQLTFSIIRGNHEPINGIVSRDEAYCVKLLEQERAFWKCVQNRDRPSKLGNEDPDLAVMAATIPINGRRPYDLSTNNEFVALASDYRALKPHADRFKEVDKDLRKLIPADASIVTGGGLQLKRDARGAFRCTITEE